MPKIKGIISQNSKNIIALHASNSACTSCSMSSNCNASVSIAIADIPELQQNQLQAEDEIDISISNKLLLTATILIYFLPLLVFIGSIWIFSYFKLAEYLVLSYSLLNLILYLLISKVKVIDNLINIQVFNKKKFKHNLWHCYFD